MGLLTSEIHLSKNRLTINNSVGPISGVPVPLFWRPPYLANHRPVILLINGNSASAAETFAAALVENGVAIAIGGKTFGKGIGQIYVPIGNGHRIRITHLKSFTPQSNWLGDAGQSVADGVRPQIEVADSPPNKRDRQLERAIERAKELIP